MKTFWVGPTGWRDRQEPDGTVIWTAPTGHTYVTKPGGALYFPQLATPTGELDLPAWSPTGNRGAMMPTRRRTRAQDRAYRIWLERNHNQERIAAAAIEAAAAEHARRITAANDPPPF
ncbi:hypothetical protein [Mycolicibacter icosiumassiliensis]|uniref:hypothetical protein n=1 Tax=Mycolicibacter icosiumassiliensis TaxID=1792835 RepID=UPI00389B3969